MSEQLSLAWDAEPTKRCSACDCVLPFSAFHRNRTRKDGRQVRCRECNIALNKQWYRDHPEARPRRMDDYARRRRRALQEQVLEYLLDHPCVDCGEDDPVVLDFDHLRDKIANISLMVNACRPWRIILEEIAKCEVVCANCHRRRTAMRIRSFRYLQGAGDDPE